MWLNPESVSVHVSICMLQYVSFYIMLFSRKHGGGGVMDAWMDGMMDLVGFPV